MNFIAVFAAFVVFWILSSLIWHLFQAIWGHLLPKFFPIDLASKYGSWAVVTGSTDGIGKAYAKELARRGLNIVLISRNQDKLNQVSREIELECNVETKTIAADYSKGQGIVEKIRAELKAIPVGILVNNVGKQYTFPTYLAEVSEQELWDVINVNCGATTMMTRMIIEGMVARKRGAIVNISSSSELQPLPLMTVYAASKVYIKSFSEALRFEYTKDNITVQHLSPFFVSTKMNAFSHRFADSSLFVPSAETYAKNAVGTLGYLKNSTGYWAHGIQFFLAKLPPVWIRKYCGGVMNMVLRKDYLTSRTQKINL